MRFAFELDAYGNNTIIALHDYETHIPGVKTFQQIGADLDANMAAVDREFADWLSEVPAIEVEA